MAKSTTITDIYKVAVCELSVDDKVYDVSAFRVSLAENGVPSITLSFAKGEAKGSKKTELQEKESSGVEVVRLTAEDYFKLYTETQRYCEEGVPASFQFKLIEQGSKKVVQQLYLKDWVCAMSGFDTFTATGGVRFGLTLMHPIYKLYRSSIHLSDVDTSVLKKLLNMAPSSQAKNILELTHEIAGKYISKVYPKVGQEERSFLELYIAVLKQLPDVITFKGAEAPDWPTILSTPVMLSATKRNIDKYVSSSLQATNVLRYWLETLLPDWFLRAQPRYNGPFRISPLRPWAKASLSLALKDIEAFNFPASDTTPIIGVAYTDKWHYSQKYGIFLSEAPKNEQITKASSFVVEWVDGKVNDDLIGTVYFAHLPEWLYNAIFNQKTAKIFISEAIKGTASNLTPEQAARQLQKYTSSVRGTVKDQLMLLYRAGIQMTITTKLMLQTSDGKDLLPGTVCDIIPSPVSSRTSMVKLRESGVSLGVSRASKDSSGLRFYITDIVHIVDAKGGIAQTEIAGNYVRPQNMYFQGEEDCQGATYAPKGV